MEQLIMLNNRKFRYAMELDGLRGIAVLMVLLVHAVQSGPNQTTGAIGNSLKLVFDFGWSGVELFFVLSGFLITSLTLNGDPNKGWVGSFYIKRFFRIVPALAVTVILILAIAGYNSIGVIDDFDILYKNLLYFIFLSPNWLAVDLICECQSAAQLSEQLQPLLARPCTNGWFPGIGYIGHLWTIGVEIHFYLLWPLFVIAMKRSIKKLIQATVLILVVSLIIRLIMWQFLDSQAIQGNDWTIIYTNTLSRLDSLFWGVMMALLLKADVSIEKLKRIKLSATILFIGFIGVSVFVDGRVSPISPLVFILGFSLISFFYATIVLHLYLNSGSGGSISLFRIPWLRKIGQYSYVIYLVHHPLMFIIGPIVKKHIGNELIWQLVYLPLLLSICVIISKLFWIAIEKPSMDFATTLIKKKYE